MVQAQQALQPKAAAKALGVVVAGTLVPVVAPAGV